MYNQSNAITCFKFMTKFIVLNIINYTYISKESEPF